MNKGGVLNAEEALESGISLAKKAGKSMSKVASDTAKAATSQVGISPQAQDQSTKDFVKDLYGAGKKSQQSGGNQASNPQAASPQNPTNADLPKSPEEQQKLAEVRTNLQKRHDEFYYEPLVNPKKDKPEERPAEKVEIEKQQEMVDLQKKEEKKPPPLSIQRAQTKTEKFPGGGG